MENTFWIIAAVIVVIAVVILALGLLGVNLGPFSTYFNRIRLGSNLCNQMVSNGCTENYKPEIEQMKSGILKNEIGQRLPNPNNKNDDANKALFWEVCEYIGFSSAKFDDCLKYCNCKTES